MSMASSIITLSIFSLPFVFVFLSSSDAHSLKACKFDSIYQLGDSIADTGNLVREYPNVPCSRLPYGQTFFNHTPTGRCSNGLPIIDYFALDSRLPWVNPYLNKDASTKNGVNFAVTGSTALSPKVLSQKNISSPFTNSSLNVQLDWMLSHFNSICHNQRDCKKKLKNSLFLVGEIGGNDYNYALLQGKAIQEVKDMVPEVVQTIKSVVERVISYGATRVVVSGNFPFGCIPIFLFVFQTNDTTAYDDEFHCLKSLNALARYHNDQIKQAIVELKKEHPRTVIVYGDYYSPFLQIFHRASILGFDESSLQKSCCGIGGNYNLNPMKMCGDPEVPVCSNPNEYISWDGIHLTQKAYKFISNCLINTIFPQLNWLVW